MLARNSTAGLAIEESGNMPPEPAVDGVETPAPKKKKTSTLRRAFSWLRGRRKKKKKTEADGPKAKKKEEKAKSKSKAAIKAEEDKRQASQHKGSDRQQENVFFPSTRPPDLEELHIQAQEGLKSQQNQEKHKHNKNDKDQTDSTSIASSPVLAADSDDVAFRGRSLSCAAENTSEDTLSIRSEMIQRTGSTFRPHDASKKSSERSGKRRKERRTTVVGVPQHIQKELGIHDNHAVRRGTLDIFQKDNVSHKSQKDGDPSLPRMQNGGEPGQDVVFIPTVDGSMEPLSPAEGGVHVSLQVLEGGRTQKEIEADQAFQIHMHKIYYDDTNIGKKNVKVSPFLRPKSLAVPGMTTHGGQSELMGPVMSISPQGTYLSKIIPNAILPPMVDVIALTKNSVRTLSRCSLSSASPASVRSSLRHYHSRHNSSSSDNWSHSQSTETIVSNTSTISSQGGSTGTLPNENAELSRESDRRTPLGEGRSPRPSDDQLSLSSSIGSRMNGSAGGHLLTVVPPSGRASPAYSVGSAAYSVGSAADASDTMSITSDRSSVRNVSLRKRKKPPAPPRRTYSLQQQREMGLPPKPEKRPPTKATGNAGAKDPWVKRLGNSSTGGEDEVFTSSVSSESNAISSTIPGRISDAASPAPGKRDVLTEPQLAVSQLSRQKPCSPEHFERTTSPSSGYSSQSGTPTLTTKSLLDHSSSPHLRRTQPIKQEQIEVLHSNAISISSSSTSLSSSISDSTRQEIVPISSAQQPGTPACIRSATSEVHNEDMVIPPHPKVPAPLFPPPSKPKPVIPDSSTTMTVLQEPSLSKAAENLPGRLKTGNSPPPSPPPSYHPPPPPAKKSESDSEVSPMTPSKDPSWPPPPPPAPDEHDLSMADFPPPEEDHLVAPLPPAASQPLNIVPSKPVPPADIPQVAAEPAPTRIPTPSTHSFSARVSSRIQQQGGSHLPQRPAPSGDISQTKLQLASVSPMLISGARCLDNSTLIITAARAGSAAPPTTASTVAAVEPALPPMPQTLEPSPVSSVSAPASAHNDAMPPPAPVAPAPPPAPVAPTPPLVPAAPKPPPAPAATKPPPAPSVPIPPSAPAAPTIAPESLKLNTVPLSFRPQQSLKNTGPTTGEDAKKTVIRSKSIQTPKEEATLPIVTPSLLQMVRLRSVQAGRSPLTEPKTQLQDQNEPTPGSSAPLKPIRKSLSLRSPPANGDIMHSNPLHEAVQLKVSVLSSSGTPGLPSADNSLHTTPHVASTSESSETKDGQTSPLRKSPANTASFIFAKSPKKVVIDPVASPESQAGLQKNLVAELKSYSVPRTTDTDQQNKLPQSKPVLQKKPSKIPPPVARKPSQSTPRSPTSPQPWASPRSPLGPQPWGLTRSPSRVHAPSGDPTASVSQDIKANIVSSEPKDLSSENGRAVQLAGQDPQPGPVAAQEEAGSSAP